MGPWDVFKDAIYYAIAWFHSWCDDWGLAVILITILFRLLIYPITRKQFHSTYKMQKMQPRIQALREKYKDDPQRLQQETAKLYQEIGFNPLSGCLPMLLQMPLFIALYQVLLELPERVGQAGAISFYNVIPDLSWSPGSVFASGDILATVPYVLLLLFFGVSSLVPMLINGQKDSQTRIMMIVMAVMMLYIGWNAPAGVLLYWDASSLLGIGQQVLSRRSMKKKDEVAEAEMIEITPVKVEIDRKEKKARPRKKN